MPLQPPDNCPHCGSKAYAWHSSSGENGIFCENTDECGAKMISNMWYPALLVRWNRRADVSEKRSQVFLLPSEKAGHNKKGGLKDVKVV